MSSIIVSSTILKTKVFRITIFKKQYSYQNKYAFHRHETKGLRSTSDRNVNSNKKKSKYFKIMSASEFLRGHKSIKKISLNKLINVANSMFSAYPKVFPFCQRANIYKRKL